MGRCADAVVSSGGGLGRVRLTLRRSELCCRAASWRERKREGARQGWESMKIWEDKDAWKERDWKGQTEEQGSVDSDKWDWAMGKLNGEGWEMVDL